ncbi:MAG: N-glycosylase/DNA lyase [Candidatus Woesearchaeota archaeon]
MGKIISEIKKISRSNIRKIVNKRLKEFSDLRKKINDEWFSELCFCLLTANAKAKTAIKIQKEIGRQGFRNYTFEKLREYIIKNKHRFHNNKAKYIVLARKNKNIKEIIISIIKKNDYENQLNAREWLVKNIKGLGYKEASHFLRNVGYFNLAILDRHILRLLHKNKIIRGIPKSLTKSKYLKIEKKFRELAKQLKMSESELDLYMWYMKTGEVLK